MFDELLNIVSVNISTVHKIIHTNDRLRGIVFSNDTPTQPEADGNTQFTKLIEGVPSEQEWLVYDRCAVVTRLYAIYERFVEDLIAEWLELLPDIVTEYSDLEKSIKDTHQIGVGRLLLDLKKKRFEHLSINEVIQGLFKGVTAQGKYKLIPDAFLLHEQNLRTEVLEKLFDDAGISNAWDWVKKHRTVKQFVEEVLGSQDTAKGELNKLITYRNDAAHGAIVDDTVGTKELLEFDEFVEALCKSLAELVTFKIIERQTLIGKAREIGNIRQWLDNIRVARARVKEINLSVGAKLFLRKESSSCCCLATIESIKMDELTKNEVEITDERDVDLKLDIFDAKKGLSIYVVE